ncbi:MAG: hypothetical protein KF726_11480 [Anaerolineae bacterium]|nr:hypothetical protein [Anaerolineae bacterium]
MAKLPTGDQAVVPEAKITRYLLDLTSKQGKPKAQFFIAFGFTMEVWELLATALKQHALAHDIASVRETRYGIHYNIEGELQTPDERNPRVRSVWKIEKDATIPALVTAYPLDELDEKADDATL